MRVDDEHVLSYPDTGRTHPVSGPAVRWCTKHYVSRNQPQTKPCSRPSPLHISDQAWLFATAHLSIWQRLRKS